MRKKKSFRRFLINRLIMDFHIFRGEK